MTIHYVYEFTAADGAPLYVGCTQHIDKRLRSHRATQPWWNEVADVRLRVFPTKDSGFAAERDLIARLKPRHNTHLVTNPGPEFFRRWAGGESYAAIARDCGCSRQFVHQEIGRQPSWLLGLARRRAAARRRLREYEANHFACCVCGTDSVDSARRRFCSADCYDRWYALRFHLPGIAERHRIDVATCNVRSGRGVDRDRRVLAGEAPPKNREFLMPGSAADDAAREAFASGWPVFDLLPIAIRERIAGVEPDLVCERCGAGFVSRPNGANRFCGVECYRAAGIGKPAFSEAAA